MPGENIAIPWPQRDMPVLDAHQCDTKIVDVDAQTFVPTLLRRPMPRAVINELRNKYSAFRTRHEDRYIEKIAEKEQEKKAKKEINSFSSASVRTALQEFNLQQRKERSARGKPRLTPDMLEKIGEVIARSKARMLNGSGISEVVPVTPVSSAPVDSHPPPQ